MVPEFEQRWRQARALENAGNASAAKQIYEALIAEDPARLYVRLRLSSIALAENDYCLAREHALLCAEDVRTKRWKDLAAVARHLLSFDERRLVKELIAGVDWAHPDIVRSSAPLSQYLWLIGEVGMALEFIDTVRPRLAPNALLLYSRATALGYLGRMSEATEEFERCIELNPSEVHVHWSLANHQKSDPPGSRIARVEKARMAYGEESQEQPFLHYALFKEHEDAGDFECAWHHLQRGAAIKRKQIRYEPTVEQEGFAQLMEMASPAFFETRTSLESATHAPIFVVGMPRSGTTLLERILGGNQRMVAGGELNDFISALCLESNQFLGAFVRPEALRKLRNVDFERVGRCYLERTVHLAGRGQFLIDKNPANFVYSGLIAKALPNAKILCLRRNPMDACFSNLKNLFTNDAYGYGYDLDELADYYIRFDRLCAHWRETIGDQFMEVSYEGLVHDTHGAGKAIMAFCGLPFDPESVDITRNRAPVTTASSAQVRQPINSRGIGAWRKYEGHLQSMRDRIEAALGPVA